jgi:hypothetical protein
MVRSRKLGYVFLALSLVPLGFLAYTLLNIEALSIPITHPRVIVEASSFVALVVVGFWLSTKKPT